MINSKHFSKNLQNFLGRNSRADFHQNNYSALELQLNDILQVDPQQIKLLNHLTMQISA